MNKKTKIGIVGFGGFGKFIFDALSQSENFEVTAIADNQKKETHIPGSVIFFSTWEKMAASKKIEAVLISTPPFSHFELALAFLNAGKHVLAEKPISVSFNSARKLKEAAKENNCVLMVDFMQRFNPILEVFQKAYKNGLFGSFERYLVENYAQDESLAPSHWFWDQQISGGILIEHAVHFIDIVHWFNDAEIKTISGYADKRNATQIDRVFAHVQYQDGLMASHYHSFSRPNIFEKTNMRFVFNTAQFDLNGWIPESGSFTLLGNDETLNSLSELSNLNITKKEKTDALKVRGKSFEYSHMIEGTFSSSNTKQELYSDCVRKIFNDFHLNIQNRNHCSRVTIDNAIKAVQVAEQATLQATVTE